MHEGQFTPAGGSGRTITAPSCIGTSPEFPQVSISALRSRGHGPFAARVGTTAVDCDARKGNLYIESSSVSRFDAENRPMCVGDRSRR